MNTPDLISTTVYDLILASPMTKITDVEPEQVLSEIKMDSLEKLSMAMDLEETFKIEMSDEDIEGFETVSDVITYLQRAVQSSEQMSEQMSEQISE
jgi:acyl carrier protein